MESKEFELSNVKKIVIVISLMSITAIISYNIYPYAQPYEVVGVCIEKDLKLHQVSLYLLSNDKMNMINANQIFTYQLNEDDLSWIRKGDIVIVRIIGLQAHVIALRSLDVEIPVYVYHEFGESRSLGHAAIAIEPILLPRTFHIFRRSEGDWDWTRWETFGLFLHPHDRIHLSFNSTEPIDFKMGLSRDPQTEYGVVVLTSYDELLMDKPSITSYTYEFEAQENGLYIFSFSSTLKESEATIVFDIKRIW